MVWAPWSIHALSCRRFSRRKAAVWSGLEDTVLSTVLYRTAVWSGFRREHKISKCMPVCIVMSTVLVYTCIVFLGLCGHFMPQLQNDATNGVCSWVCFFHVMFQASESSLKCFKLCSEILTCDHSCRLLIYTNLKKSSACHLDGKTPYERFSESVYQWVWKCLEGSETFCGSTAVCPLFHWLTMLLNELDGMIDHGRNAFLGLKLKTKMSCTPRRSTCVSGQPTTDHNITPSDIGIAWHPSSGADERQNHGCLLYQSPVILYLLETCAEQVMFLQYISKCLAILAQRSGH